ncbi:ribokinase [Paraburkholderia phosphatilytica]|uniref:ribokinase n=1 Tax=Paraburkholderia phosphatilytica TaxID=2282883 RepID=UPI000E489D69|nr:ribokinase [Paraburkholderia phosphatilytica]
MSKAAKQGRVVVVGSINTDLVARAPHLPRPGETISGQEFSQVAGGKGANQAVAAARIGAHVAMVGCVGSDANGDQRLRDLEAEGIDCAGIETSESQPTGVALITVSDEGQNTIVVVAGSNGELTPEGVQRHEAMLRAADVVVCQLESPWDAVHATLALARRLGKTTVLNPAPATEPLPAEWMPLIDYLVPNEVEAAILAGLPVESESGARRAAMELQRAGARNVIVTLGAQGAYLLREGGEGAHFAAPEVQAVDTTAAGDTFIGVFASQLAARQPLDAAIGLAQRAAAISVTRAGAQPSIPTREEVERFA